MSKSAFMRLGLNMTVLPSPPGLLFGGRRAVGGRGRSLFPDELHEDVLEALSWLPCAVDGDDLCGRAGGDYLPVVHYGNDISQLLGLVEIVSGEKHAPSFALQRADHVPDCPSRL